MAAVMVRWARVEELPADLGSLSAPERARLRSLREEGDRQRFVGARVLLRHVVAAVTGCACEDVFLRQSCHRCGGPHGRPIVEIPGRRRIEVSMAHAGDLVAVAVSRSPVGVDVEPVRALQRAEPGQLIRWVRMEALLKSTGEGLGVDPRLVDVGSPASPPRLQTWLGPGRPPAARLADIVPEPGYVAAVSRLGRRPLRLDARAFKLDRPG